MKKYSTWMWITIIVAILCIRECYVNKVYYEHIEENQQVRN